MKELVVGILAHVDAGKTTLSEALLYRSGTLRRLGRVDHGDAFLDTDALERERGITIFSKQALLTLGDTELQLLDTPGHADFSAEAERTLQILDYAILVISGTDGVQSHTRTLWRLLRRYRVPTFLFINKMDLAGADRIGVLEAVRRQLDDGCVDFSGPMDDEFYDSVALCGETALSEYLECGTVSENTIAALIRQRKLFPCWFGSALRLTGVDEFLAGLDHYTRAPSYPAEFGAKVYKIMRDAQGTRLTCLKVTGGTLRVKTPLTNRRDGTADDAVWEEKADQLRIYSGAKFRTADEVCAGAVCAVTGLTHTRPGDGLGCEGASAPPTLEPVLTYQVLLPADCDLSAALRAMRTLEDEDPQLHVVWNEQLREIHVQLMGAIQLEILQRLLRERFGLEAGFGPGNIVYRETIAAPVEGIGHFEPLRHYAEVHLLLEPLPRGSGLQLAAACPEELLDFRWQRLILAHLGERTHPGVLTGAPITDMKITLTAGRAHVKHTEGGDFRQATYRAVRQGLMQAQNILLEPWYDFRLEIPAECLGRAMADLQRMGGEAAPPETAEELTVLSGSAPAAELRDYAAEIAAYTRGRGRLFCSFRDYAPCRDQDAAAAASGYEAERDLDNPADSVFCDHGAGLLVHWDEVPRRAHIAPGIRAERSTAAPAACAQAERSAAYVGTAAQDKELQAIYERTYGPIRRRDILPTEVAKKREAAAQSAEKRAIAEPDSGPEYLLVDGYNIIYAWDELKAVAQDNLDAARKLLMDILSNYQGFRKCEVILVFDAYKVPHGAGEIFRYHNLSVVYTKAAETADSFIEKTTYRLGSNCRVRVATSDGAEQLIILCHGALRVPASAFRDEVVQTQGQIADILRRNNCSGKTRALGAALERAAQSEADSKPPREAEQRPALPKNFTPQE